MKQIQTIRMLAVLAVTAMSGLSVKAQWELVDPLPVPLGEFSPAVLNGKIYVFGGKIDGLHSSDTVWIYDPDLGWDSGGKMPDSLEDVMVEEYGGLFYLFGGHSHPDFIYRQEVMTYDPVTQIFDTVGTMPHPAGFFTTAVLNDKIYLMGGGSNKVDIFNPADSTWEVGPNMSIPRIVAYADTLNGKIFVTGGSDGNNAYNSMDVFDPGTGWTLSPATMHDPRGFHACASGYGKLYALGGTNLSIPVLDKVEYFDPALNAWVDLDPMIYARRKLGAAVLGEYLYAIGGGGTNGQYMTTVERRKIYEEPQEFEVWEHLPPMPTPRAYCTGSVVDGKIYVIGGAYSQQESSDVVEMFNPENDSWHTLPPLPDPIVGAASAVIGGKIYVVGGMDVYLQNPLNTLYVYDPADSSWTELLPMPTARGFLAASELGGKLYAIGGTTNFPNRVDKVEMYDPVTGVWESKTPMATPRSGFCTEALDGKIYAMGGVSQYGYYDLLEVYDTLSNAWAFRENLPEVRAIFGSGVIGDAIFVFGGSDATTPNTTMVRYNPESDKWTQEQQMPELKVAFASVEIDPCVYAIGGALWPFYTGGPGDKVTGDVLIYCDTTIPVFERKTILSSVSLSQNAPNPFSTQTTITYELKSPTDVLIQVFDLSGRVVATLFDGRQGAGEYSVTWDAAGMPAGVYCYRLQTNEGVVTRKCVLQ